jgi:dTDP-glucose pyrophosphorylase
MGLTLVVPAAGKGSRLAEKADGKPKVMIRIGEKPVLQFALDAGLRMPVSDIVIVIGSDGCEIERFFGASYCGLPIRYVTQPKPLGLAHAVSLSERYVSDSMVVINGDEIFLDNRQAEMYRLFLDTGADGVVGYLLTSETERIQIGYGMDVAPDGRVVKLIEKPKETWNSILGVGTWLLRKVFFDFFVETPVNQARGERDFVDVIQLMINRGKLILGFDLKGEFVNLNMPEDLKRAESALGRRVQIVAGF